MHASSMENMLKCYLRYICGSYMDQRESITVLDVGGPDVDGTYHDIFSHSKFNYVTADLEPNEGVTLILDDPYHIPLETSSVDLVISGQTFEHVELFWDLFQEMNRVVKDDGYIFLITPSSGPIHQFPVDCYRFYPDGYKALAKYVKTQLLEIWLDERGPWRDLVGVFSKKANGLSETSTSVNENQINPLYLPDIPGLAPAPLSFPKGTSDVEVIAGEKSYLDILRLIHDELKPDLYLEIGVRRGFSLRFGRCKTIAVDPQPDLESPLENHVSLYQMTSDTFFDFHAAGAIHGAITLSFIDGMHLFEYALRDFMQIEKLSHPAGVVVIDDIFPNHVKQAERKRHTHAWSGDLWKLNSCLREMRSDLILIPIDASPSGLLIVAGLDPGNRVLWGNYNPIVRQYLSDQYSSPELSVIEREQALSPDDERIRKLLIALKEGRSIGMIREDIIRDIKFILDIDKVNALDYG